MTKTDKKHSLAKAKENVFKLLNYRLRSEFEIQYKLNKKGFDNSVIKETTQYFKQLELIDDNIFARKWISSRLRRPFGASRIKLELKKKGVSRDIIEQEIKKAVSHEDYEEFDVVHELALRRKEKYKGIEKQKVKQRIYGYLIRRGFSINTIIKVIKEL